MNYGFFCVADAIALGAGSCVCRNVLHLPYSVASWIQIVSAIHTVAIIYVHAVALRRCCGSIHLDSNIFCLLVCATKYTYSFMRYSTTASTIISMATRTPPLGSIYKLYVTDYDSS